jgi:hypothetical protein
MSAFIVSKQHIDAIVSAATSKWGQFSYYHDGSRRAFDRNQAGAMLWEECRKSVAHRYPGDGDGNWPGPSGLTQAEIAGYRYTEPVKVFPLVASLALIDSYEYQACEHDEWDASEARSLCGAIRRALIRRLPGYDEVEAL